MIELTRRQRQVLELIAEGMTTKEIAARLGISEHTANDYRKALRMKIGAGNAAQMVRIAIEQKVLAAGA